ncbi:MAG: adenosylcobinamide-phosphate synthase CbiB [Dehalococcoidia bacterium]
MRAALTLLAALALDDRFGEPPAAWHPVRLIGRAITAIEARAPLDGPGRLRYGAAMAGAIPFGAAAVALMASRLARRVHAVVGFVFDAALLSSMLARRSLFGRAREVETALEAGDLDGARASLGRHLVSRDTSELDASEVSGATIESVAENLSDGFTGPVLAYALGGMPGAVAYRAVNTLDSMWGYRREPYTELGRHPARLDDAINLVPSRVTAGVIVAASAVDAPEDARRAFDTWLDEGDLTESPNAGQPMGAMAGALGRRLEKRGAYVLGLGFEAPAAGDIARAVRIANRASMIIAASAVALTLWRHR